MRITSSVDLRNRGVETKQSKKSIVTKVKMGQEDICSNLLISMLGCFLLFSLYFSYVFVSAGFRVFLFNCKLFLETRSICSTLLFFNLMFATIYVCTHFEYRATV